MAKRILIFSLSYYPMVGGAEVAIHEIASRIPEGEIEFDLVTLRFSKAHAKHERIGHVDVYRIGGGLGYLSKILFVPQATLFALKRKYDLYWAMMTYMLFPISLIRLLGGRTPYILTLQDGDPFAHVFNRLRIIFFKPLLSYGFRHAHKVQTISNFLAEWARRAGTKSSIEVIPNGVDVERFEESGESVKKGGVTTLITVSRLVKKNGVEDIIRALPFLPENVHLRILGSGPLKPELAHVVKKLGLESRAKFDGFVSQEDLPQFLHHADIFVRPSLSEGQGISFIEAMAAGLPVIATPVGGIPDFLKDGETGLFVEPKSPKLIAFQVQKLLSDRVLRDKIVINAKRMVREKFDWSLIAEEMRSKVFNL